MPTCEPSPILRSVAPRLREAVRRLKERYDYASALGTDSSGATYSATPGERRAGDSPWVERGIVFRIQEGGAIVECAFNELPDGDLAEAVADAADPLLAASGSARRYPPIPDEPARASRLGTVAEDPFAADPDVILARLGATREALQSASPEIVFASAQAEFMRVAKVFISPNRDLEQVFTWGQAYMAAVGKRGDVTKEDYHAFAGLKGIELIDEMPAKCSTLATELSDILGAVKMDPGEYEVIMDPDVTGTLAHEAFGHGVETDMFVKGRARAAEYLGKPVASPMVRMFDGAAGVDQCGSFLFDDEGTFATRTTIIDGGILKSGISDLQSAMVLGQPPTGNGRRQSYDHKAYARMTNTYFEPGSSRYEDMVASIEHGWLLQKMNSGMEDPKNWGIQLVVLVGREIRDGKLTGRVASPIVCSGYVPDVLSNISMLSGDFELGGAGYCGKGYKEFVKVSMGGPYVKTKMRLG